MTKVYLHPTTPTTHINQFWPIYLFKYNAQPKRYLFVSATSIVWSEAATRIHILYLLSFQKNHFFIWKKPGKFFTPTYNDKKLQSHMINEFNGKQEYLESSTTITVLHSTSTIFVLSPGEMAALTTLDSYLSTKMVSLPCSIIFLRPPSKARYLQISWKGMVGGSSL